MDFGTDKIYASNGVTIKSIYISSFVYGREEEIFRCQELLDVKKVQLIFFSDTNEYLVYSFHIDKTGENRRVFNLLMSFEQLGEMLRVQDKNQFFELENVSGRRLIFG